MGNSIEAMHQLQINPYGADGEGFTLFSSASLDLRVKKYVATEYTIWVILFITV